MKALALFSGGLDSALAIKIIKDQGIEVIAFNFVSHFFGGKNGTSTQNLILTLVCFWPWVRWVSVSSKRTTQNKVSPRSDMTSGHLNGKKIKLPISFLIKFYNLTYDAQFIILEKY